MSLDMVTTSVEEVYVSMAEEVAEKVGEELDEVEEDTS